MNAKEPFDQDSELLSFGPHFGEEAANELIRRLEGAQLDYADDFYMYAVDVPEWCGLSCSLRRETDVVS